MTNANGCDSTVITTTALLLPDTVYLNATTCNPALVGVSLQTLTNANGCDSTVITTTTLLLPDTRLPQRNDLRSGTGRRLPANPDQRKRLRQSTFTVMRNDFSPALRQLFTRLDIVYLSATTCDPTQVGVSLQTLTNVNGCDSIVITTTTLLLSDTST